MALELSLDDLLISWKKVARNKGMAGTDGVTINSHQQNKQ